MKNALIIHGNGGHPKENWNAWLKEKLEENGYEVWVPQLPNKDKPNLKKYVQFFRESDFDFNDETVLVGHSSGAVTILGILSALDISVHKAILAGAFIDALGWDSLSDLFTVDFNWNKMKKSAKDIQIINSDDDPYVPLEQGQYIADKLGVKLNIMEGQKHFNESLLPKYNKFPELLEIILS